MPRKKGTGLGLNDVFPVASAATEAALSQMIPEVEQAVRLVIQDLERTYGNIPIEQIIPNPYQPRKNFNTQRLQELADSLQEDGMLEPILVRVSPTQSSVYEIAAGERRWRAAKLAGWTYCPAEIIAVCPDAKMKRIALLENIQREQLTPLELAEIYDALLHETEDGTPVYTVRSLAEMLKKNKGHIDEHRALLRVPPDVRKLIEDDPDIPPRIIREIGGIEEVLDRAYLIEEVRARNLKTADVVAILQQRRRTRQNEQISLPQPSISSQERSSSASALELPQRTGAAQEDRSSAQPSSDLAIAVLERKILRGQSQLEKLASQIEEELVLLDLAGKEKVHHYLAQWCKTLQEVIAKCEAG